MEKNNWHTPTWDEIFMRDVYNIASKSKDDKTKIGAVLVSDNVQLTKGYNGMCRKVNDLASDRYERPEKYFWFEHAERNSLYNATRRGISTDGATMYTQGCPCADCARGVIQTGIVEVVLHAEYESIWENKRPNWKESQDRSMTMFKEAGIKIRYFSGSLGVKTMIDGIVYDL